MTWRRLLVLDLALVTILASGAIRLHRSWNEFATLHGIETIRPEKETARTVPGASVPSTSVEDWTEIPVKNPFSFDRNDIAIIAVKQAPPTGPKPVLLGTMSVGNEWIAMMASPSTGSRGSRPVKIGESLDTWQVVEIREKSVVVTTENGARETVIMNDPTAQVARVYDRTGNSAAPPAVNVVAPSVPNPSFSAPTTSSAPAPAATQPGAASQQADEILQTPFGPVRRTRP